MQSLLRTALVVETNYLVASVMEAPLLAAGYSVVIALNQDEAFEALASRKVYLALIDFRLQHGGPEGLTARLERAGVPFIFCTAASVEEVSEHFPHARVMPKPFSDEQLLQVVRELGALWEERQQRPSYPSVVRDGAEESN